MVVKNYIADGYTEDALINAIPNMHGAVKFKFRVLLSDRIREILNSWDLISAAEKTRRTHGVIVKQVISWDLEDDGKPLPISGDTLVHLKRNIVERMFNIITQLDVSDDVSSQKEDLDLDKLLGDKSAEEEDVKN